MKITISGKPGSGTSTISKLLSEKLGYEHLSTGDFMRDLASDKKLSLLELSKLAEEDDEVDKLLDARQEKFGKEKEDFVLDARIGFHFIPDSKKIYLDVSDEEAIKRIKKREQDSTEEEYYDRLNSERKRYKKLYNLDFEDFNNYDIVIKTDKLKPDEILNLILKMI